MNLLDKLFIRADLANHAVYGVVLYWLGSWVNPWIGLAVAAAFALLKEFLVDKKLGKGQFDSADILATVALPILLFIQTAGGLPWIQ